MNTPLFSIITPVLNGVAGLEKTIKSVLAQPHDLFEFLVLDGGSADGTKKLLQAQGDAVRWVSEPDGGVYPAMNKGLTRTSGEFLYFLGAGDTLRPGALEAVAAQIPRKPLTYFYGNVYAEAYGRVYNGHYSPWKLSRLNICHQAVFAHRSVFARVGPFDPRYAIMADHVWNMKVFGDPAITKIYSELVIADYAAGGLSQQRPDPQLIADRLALIKEHLGPLPYALNKSAALVPPGLKEARFQAFQKLKAAWRSAHANRH